MMRAACCAALVLTLGCKGDGTTDTDTNTDTFNIDTGIDTTGTALAEMRVVNLAVGEDPAKLHVDSRDNAVLNNLEPFNGSDWRQLNSGARTFRVGPEGGDEDTEWASLDVTLEAEERYTLIIHGSGDDIRLVAYHEDARTIPEGDARYSLMNAGFDLEPFDVLDVTDPKAVTPMTEDLAFGVGPVFVEQAAKELQLGIDLDRDGTAEATFEVPDLGRTVLPLYVLLDADRTLVMAGQAPQGAVRIQESKVTVKPTGAKTGGKGSP